MASSSKKKNNTMDGQGGSSATAIRPEDVEWLASLLEHELDFLISLKEMAIKRAKNVGYGDLGEKLDVRILRELGAITLEHLKERVQSTSAFPNSSEMLTLLSGCRLSTPIQESLGSTSRTEDINTSSFVDPRRKRRRERLSEEQPSHYKKQKREDRDM